MVSVKVELSVCVPSRKDETRLRTTFSSFLRSSPSITGITH